MTQVTRRPITLMAAAAVAVAFLHAPLAGQQAVKSAAGARALAEILEKASLDAMAAQVPGTEDTFVAALLIPGQLLVVSARYSAPSLLQSKIDQKNYREVYVDLNSAATPKSRYFVEDLNADGLHYKPNEGTGYDTFDSPEASAAFDGEWRKRRMSEDEYRRQFTEADEHYTRMLETLLAQARKNGTE
jgi:hypothetical protein